MDRLRAIADAFRHAVVLLYSGLLNLISHIGRALFGRLSWQPPGWSQYVSRRAAPIKKATLAHKGKVALTILVAGLAYWFSPAIKSAWLTVVPETSKPPIVSLTVTAPARTELENEGKPNPVVVEFADSVAPLGRIGKSAQYVSLSPAHPGEWTWTSDRRLEFRPRTDWPIDTEFQIQFGPKALAPSVALSGDTVQFRTAAFEVTIASAEFYQDPTQAGLRKAIFEVHFSHPVRSSDFEKKLGLRYHDASAPSLFGLNASSRMKYTVNYDKYKMRATVQSEPLSIPAEPTALILTVAPGATAQKGGKPTAREISRAIDVPGLYSLAVTRVEDTVVTGDDGEPEHILQWETNMPVHEREAANAVAMWSLPHRQAPDGTNKAWEDPEEIDAEILKRSTRVKLTPVPREQEAGTTHAYKYKADPGTFLYVEIKSGLTGVGGYQLRNKQSSIVRVKAFAPELTIMSTGALLALDGEKKLPILIRDLPGVRLEIARVLPHQLHLLAVHGDGSFSSPDFYNGVSPDQLSERFEKNIPLNLRPGKSHYETVDFSQYLNSASGKERRGIFLLSVRGFDPKKAPVDDEKVWTPVRHDYYEPYYDEEADGEENSESAFDPASMKDKRLVIVTDLGFIIKKAVDGARHVFVQSIGKGNAVADAQVEVWGKNGLVLATQKTDATGHAILPDLRQFVREKTPVVVIVRKGDDMAFMPVDKSDRSLDMSRFDIGGTHSSGLPDQTQAYLFSDRGIYRPGDTVHIGAIVKTTDWGQSVKDLPVEAEIIDARGLVAKREKLKVGKGGMLDFSYTTFDSSPTGTYTVNLNLPRDTGELGTGQLSRLTLGTISVKVQEFMPDRMKVRASLSSASVDGWVSPDDLKGQINVQNLFGTPAQGRRVESILTLTPAYPAFRQFPDYAFFDPRRPKGGYPENLEAVETDEQGNADIPLNLDRFEPATYRLHLLVKAFEPGGGRSVSAEASTLVSDLPFLVGFKSTDSLYYVSRNSTRAVHLIAINPAGKKTNAPGLKIQHIERRVVSVLVKQRNGVYKYESKPKDMVLKEIPLAIPASGVDLRLATDTPGNFAYVIRDADDMELNRVEYSVAGTGNISRSLDRNAELQLSLNKKEYQPGEEMEISIRAPYVGSGLITIERDKVYTHRWFKADKNASVQKIRLPKDYEGNGYITVQYVRDPASDEVYMSPLSYGAIPFSTTLASRTAAIELQSPPLVKPGSIVKMRLTSRKPVQAVVFAIDEGILQVARYQTPDPLKHFFAKRALEVSTFQTLDLILPEFKKLMQSAAPGGDAESPLGKHLNPFKRKTEKPVAYWSGIVEVNGTKEFTYTVPEHINGSLKVMAVVADDATAAASSTTTQVRGDLVLLPTVPVALTPGDEVEIGLGVANNIKNSGKDAPISVTLQTGPHLEVVGPRTQVLPVSALREGRTTFRIRARSGDHTRLGSSSVIFTAQYKQSSARLSTDLSVRPASPLVSLIQTGQFHRKAEMTSQGRFYPGFQRSQIAVSASPWSFASGLMDYLTGYPHGCTEQITSQTFPVVLMAAYPELGKELSSSNRAGEFNPEKTLARTISILRSRQTPEGGFGLWDNHYVEPFASVYATHMLIEAKERGLRVPEDMLRGATNHLLAVVTQQGKDRYQWRSRAFAAYLLTRLGSTPTAALVELRSAAPQENAQRAPDLGAAYIAASYRMAKQDKLADEWLEPVWRDFVERVRADRRFSYSDRYYDPLVHDTMLIFIVARHFPHKLKQLPPEAFMRIATMIKNGWYHSLSSSSTILAIDAYSAVATQSAAASLTAKAADRKGVWETLALARAGTLFKAQTPPDTAKIALQHNGDFPMFYAWTESGYERNIPTTPQSTGLEVIREFLDANGKVVKEATLGEELTVRLRIRGLNQSWINNVAVIDLLPGGLEPVLTALQDSEDPSAPLWQQRLGGTGSWSIEYADIREDRVMFYGSVRPEVSEVTYKVRATNVGQFVTPAAFAEAMYDRKISARSAGDRFVVKPLAAAPKKP